MLVVPSNTCGACAVGKEGFVKMKRNRVVTLIAGMILTTTLAVSAPLTVFGTDIFDNAGSGDTEFSEDAQFAEPEDLSWEDASGDDVLEDDMTGTDFMDGDSADGDGSGMELPEEDITDETEDIVEPVVYTVKYDMNGHGDSYTEEVEEGDYAVDWADSPEEEGYNFLGWFTDKKCSSLWDGNAPISSDVTVYAGWEKIEEEVEEETIVEEEVQEETDQNDSQNAAEIPGEGNTEEENSGSGDTTAEEVIEEPAEETEEEVSEGSQGAITIDFKIQPEDVTVEYPDSAEFSVEVSVEGDEESDSVAYQWYGPDDKEIKSATESTLVISPTKSEDDGNTYYCVVTYNSQTKTSNKATLHISNKDDKGDQEIIIIKNQPRDVSVAYPEAAEFSVEINEDLDSKSVSYQWYGPDDKEIESETDSTLVISPTKPEDDGNTYYCEVTYNSETVKSKKATLHISNKDDQEITIIKNHPQDVYVAYPKAAEFSVEINEDLDSKSVSYQWYGPDGNAIKSETKNKLVINPTKPEDNGNTYYCEVTYNSETVQSEEATLHISNIANTDIIKTQPKDVTVAYPNTAEFSIEINENLDSESVKYQWYGPDGKAIAAETESTLVIDPTKAEDDGKTYYCEVTYNDEKPVKSDVATLHITNKDSVFTTQPKNQAVEYPKGTTFEVAAADPDSVESYQWYLYDKSTKKEIQLDGSTATTQQLYIPSTTKQDDGRSYFCRLTLKGGKKVDSEKAVLKISNKKENKPVLYVGNYAIDPSVDSGKVSTLFLANLDISNKPAGDAANDNTFNTITFNGNTNTITFRNVHFSNSNAKYDHKYSPAVGIRLVADQNSQEKYTFEFLGENQIGIANLDSAIDDAATAFRFDFENAKKDPEIIFTEKKTDNDTKGTLKTIGGKTAIFYDGDLKIKAETTIVREAGRTSSNGIECDNLTLGEGCVLIASAYGTAVYAHDTFKMESGAKALLQSILYKNASKNAVLYAGKELDIEKAYLKVVASADDSASVSSFSGIECGGEVNISDGSNVAVPLASKDGNEIKPTVSAAGNVYGIKTSGKFELEDSHLSVWTKSSDGKGKAFGVLCGSASVSLSKEKVFTVQCVADDGIAFAALTGKSGSTEQGYQENYTPTKITFETAGVLVPASSKISSGSIKNGSKYDYIETVYNKTGTSAPAAGVRFESTNHVWGDPKYKWEKVGNDVKVTATRTCENYPSHTDHMESETVIATAKQTKAPTCTEMGQTTYTATFKNTAFKTDPKTVKNIKKLPHQFGDWVVTTKPTLTATGIKKRQCKVCKTVESAVVPKLTKGVYKVKKGADLSWNKGSDKSLEIKIVRETENDTAFSHFQGILVDGKVLNKQYYSAKSGSVIIKFKPDFLSKLAIGTHTLTFGFEDGDNPSSKLTIQNSNGSNGSNTSNSTGTTGKGPVTSAKTGDTTNILVWVLTICAAGAAVVLIQRYKKNNKDKKDKKSDSSEK